jgi:hypothetical protein
MLMERNNIDFDRLRQVLNEMRGRRVHVVFDSDVQVDTGRQKTGMPRRFGDERYRNVMQLFQTFGVYNRIRGREYEWRKAECSIK